MSVTRARDDIIDTNMLDIIYFVFVCTFIRQFLLIVTTIHE